MGKSCAGRIHSILLRDWLATALNSRPEFWQEIQESLICALPFVGMFAR